MQKTQTFEVTNNTIDRIGDFILASALDLTEEAMNTGKPHDNIKIVVTVEVE